MTVREAFEPLREKALAKWREMEGTFPRILVGTATCGRAAGALSIWEALPGELERLGIRGMTMPVGCIGLCYAEPLLDIIKEGRPRVIYRCPDVEILRRILEDYLLHDNPRPDLALATLGPGEIEGIPRLEEMPVFKTQVRVVLRNCGFINPEDIDHYIARDGYLGFIRALEMTPEEVIAEVKASGLRGRGGAGFPTGQKWEFCRRSPGTEKYLICNADEGDPGAFMNRSLLEGDPHAVLEGMLIAGYAIGATHGFIYCRAEYPLALERLRKALDQMRAYGLLGENILGSGFSFDISIREGAGAFVCGEETALMASVEGRRGMPRPRPPFPAVKGLWGKPTNINNVETLGTLPNILRNGAEWYAQFGTEKSRGTKTFSLVGKVNRTGLIEVPLGTPLSKVIYEIGGGIVGEKAFKAAQTGGPSGGCLPASALDLGLDYESLTGAGSIMGSGGLVIMDEDSCPVDIARFFLTFTQKESCGKCPPCRVGTRQMLQMLERFSRGEGRLEDIDFLFNLAQLVKNTALCGLGQTAPNPVLTTIRYFREEYEAHIRDRRCPALVCRELINFYILPDKCAGCMICARNCPVQAIRGGRRMVHVIDQEKCVKCGTCLEMCPPRFKAVVKVSGEKPEVPEEPIPVSRQEVKQ